MMHFLNLSLAGQGDCSVYFSTLILLKGLLCPSIWGLGHVFGFALYTLVMTYGLPRSFSVWAGKTERLKDKTAEPPLPLWCDP